MLVVKVYMWPQGDSTRERILTAAKFSLQGRDPETGERCYKVEVLKDTSYTKSDWNDDGRIYAHPKKDVWKGGFIRGHFPGLGKRGTWDLIGGALKVLLGRRLSNYEGYDPEETGPECAICGDVPEAKAFCPNCGEG